MNKDITKFVIVQNERIRQLTALVVSVSVTLGYMQGNSNFGSAINAKDVNNATTQMINEIENGTRKNVKNRMKDLKWEPFDSSDEDCVAINAIKALHAKQRQIKKPKFDRDDFHDGENDGGDDYVAM